MRSWLYTLALFSSSLLADDPANDIPGVDPLSSSYLLKLTLGLVAIVVLIFALAWFMKKMQLTQFSQNGLIQIVSSISVGHRDRIALIQVGEEQVLVGLTPGRITTLHTLQSRVETARSPVSGGSAFSDKFRQVLQQEKKK